MPTRTSNRPALVLSAALSSLLLAGFTCGKPPAQLGSTCKVAADCISNQCTNSVCTRGCSTQADCPTGFDCRTTASGESSSLLCVKATYQQPASGGFGTDCAAVAEGCTNAASPCANGFSCHAQTKCDATAYCTTTGCTSDLDCPPTMFCGEDYYVDPSGNAQKFQGCIKRERCDSCETDDECPNGFVCADDNLGGKFCGKPCQIDDDCLKPYKTDVGSSTMQYQSFETCQMDQGRGQRICTPGTGACHGKSAISSVMGDGQLCSPCRPGVPSDCANGLGCIQEYEGERFCTEQCEITLTFDNTSMQWNIKQGSDTCPSGTGCFFGGEVPSTCYTNLDTNPTPVSPCTVQGGHCSAATDYLGDTCYP